MECYLVYSNFNKEILKNGKKVIYETQYLNNFVENPKCKNHGSMILKTRSEKVARNYFEKARVNQEENKVNQAINNYLDKEEK